MPRGVLGDRLVGLDQAQHQGREVDLGEVGAAGAGLDLGDPQQRGEGREDRIRVLDRPVDGALVDQGLGRAEPRQLQPMAEPAERRAEVVRDVVGDLLQVQEQRLDAVEHAVEVKGQLGELVARARAHRDATTERAALDLAARPVDGLDPAKHAQGGQ